MTTTWLAPLALFTWPLVALGLYRVFPLAKATLFTILGAQLLLPPSLTYKIAMVPALDRASISTLAAIIGCYLTERNRLRFFTRFGFTEFLFLIFVFSPVITSALNND